MQKIIVLDSQNQLLIKTMREKNEKEQILNLHSMFSIFWPIVFQSRRPRGTQTHIRTCKCEIISIQIQKRAFQFQKVQKKREQITIPFRICSRGRNHKVPILLNFLIIVSSTHVRRISGNMKFRCLLSPKAFRGAPKLQTAAS